MYLSSKVHKRTGTRIKNSISAVNDIFYVLRSDRLKDNGEAFDLCSNNFDKLGVIFSKLFVGITVGEMVVPGIFDASFLLNYAWSKIIIGVENGNLWVRFKPLERRKLGREKIAVRFHS